jgi:NADPH:quinone reductase-like Zn-dependent oxidoreductase
MSCPHRGPEAGHPIGTASTDARRDLALSLGADVAVSSDADGYAERVLDANDGRPVDIVLESNGGRVFSAGLDILANFGRLVTFGNASREGCPLVDPGALAEGNTEIPLDVRHRLVSRPFAVRGSGRTRRQPVPSAATRRWSASMRAISDRTSSAARASSAPKPQFSG